MAISRQERRNGRVPKVASAFGMQTESAPDLLETVELAWHDCYQEISPPDAVIDDMLVVADGDLAALIGAARLALTDWRDLAVIASESEEPKLG